MPVDLTQIPSWIISLVIGTGALAWFMRSNTRLVLSEKNSEEAKVKAERAETRSQVLESRANQQDTIINEIRTRMAKLDRVDELVAAAKFIEEAVGKMITRTELDAWRQSIEQRISRVEQDHQINPS